MRKNSRPMKSEIMREGDFQLNFFGGMGIYHTKAHIRRNRNRFKMSPNPKSSVSYLN